MLRLLPHRRVRRRRAHGRVVHLALAASIVASSGCSTATWRNEAASPPTASVVRLDSATSEPTGETTIGTVTQSDDPASAEVFPPLDVRKDLDLIAAGAAGERAATLPWHVTYTVITSGKPLVDPEEVATMAARAYSDPHGWSLSGAIQFERVSTSEDANFILVVAEASTIPDFSDSCVNGRTGDPDASCTVGNYVLINDVRWTEGALGDPYPLDAFRMQEINHETGHWLGEDHYTCGGRGEAAPVNQQQFRNLSGCLPNQWPLAWEKALVALRHELWPVPAGTDARDLLARATAETG